MTKKINEKKRYQYTGRGRAQPFLKLLHSVVDSSEFAELGGSELKLLVELARQYNGKNNGNFDTTQLTMKWVKEGQPPRDGTSGMKPRQFPGARWNSEEKLTKARKGLLQKGWIVVTKQGGLGIGCTLYAVTWWPIDECKGKHTHPAETVASNLWRKKTPHRNQVLAAPESGAGESKKWSKSSQPAPESGAASDVLKAA